MTVTDDALLPGLADPVLDAQRIFRAALDAMARPGTVLTLPPLPPGPAPLDPATAAVALALADQDTPVWLDRAADTAAVRQHLRFHCGCPLAADAMLADFAIIADPAAMPPLSTFNTGSDEYPDRSTTLVVQLPGFDGAKAWTLAGPGIRDRARLSPAGLPPEFHGWVVENHSSFPRGVDLIFTCGARLAALPRSTRLEG